MSIDQITLQAGFDQFIAAARELEQSYAELKALVDEALAQAR